MEKDDAIELRFVSDSPTVDLGERRLAKDVIAAGRWHYLVEDPKTKKVTKQVLDVPESRVDHWIADGNAMLAAGVKIPMPLDHDENDSERNRGFVEHFEKHFDEKGVPWVRSVVTVPEVPGAEKIGTTIREVSARIVKRLVDGAGRVWTDVIRHISPCILPVIPGQGNFVELKQVTDPETLLGGSTMDELVKLLKETVGGLLVRAGIKPDEVTAENVVETLKTLLAWCTGQSWAKLSPDEQKALEAAQAKLKDVEAERDAAKAQVVELKARYEPETHEPTPEEIRLKAEVEARDTEIAALKEREIDAEVDALLKARKIVAAKAPLVKAMLRSSSAGDVRLKSVEAGKEVETEMSASDAFRVFLKSLPEGAAFASGTPAPGAKPVPKPAEEGEDVERKGLADLAKDIQLKEKIPYGEALKKAEVQLRSKA